MTWTHCDFEVLLPASERSQAPADLKMPDRIARRRQMQMQSNFIKSHRYCSECTGIKNLLIKQTMDIQHLTGCKAVSMAPYPHSTQFSLLLVIWLPTLLTFLPRIVLPCKQLLDSSSSLLFSPSFPEHSRCTNV